MFKSGRALKAAMLEVLDEQLAQHKRRTRKSSYVLGPLSPSEVKLVRVFVSSFNTPR